MLPGLLLVAVASTVLSPTAFSPTAASQDAAVTPGVAGPSNPIVASLMEIGEKGLAPGRSAAAPALSFRPDGTRQTVQAVVDLIGENEDDRKTLREGIETFIKAYEESQTGADRYDVAGAIAFDLVVLDAIANRSEPAEATVSRVRNQLRQAFRSSRRALDTNNYARQQVYETHLAVASLMLVLASVTRDEAGAQSLGAAAKKFLSAFFGGSPTQVTSQGLSVTARPRPPMTAPPGATVASTDGFAPGFSVRMPGGWEELGGWYVKVASADGPVRTLVRFPPAIPASGNMGADLNAQWELLRPQGKVDREDRNFYCRFVGGAPAYYRVGQVQEPQLQAPTFVVVTLIRAGAQWQPVVVAVTYGNPPPPYEPGAGFTAGFQYPTGATLAEQVFSQIQVQGATRTPLVNAADLVGSYGTSTGMSGTVMNSATGAVGVGYTASGWSLNLKADGTFTFRVTNAAGGPGVFASQTGSDAGRYTVEDDKLVLRGRKNQRWTIFGFTQYSDAKVLVVDWEPNRPAHAGNLGFPWTVMAPR
jgi:hypothetical protein